LLEYKSFKLEKILIKYQKMASTFIDNKVVDLQKYNKINAYQCCKLIKPICFTTLEIDI